MADSLPTSPGAGSPAPLGAEAQQPPIPQHQPADAWQRVGDNRYMPRRIKGSLLGRELGWMFLVPSGPDAQQKLFF